MQNDRHTPAQTSGTQHTLRLGYFDRTAVLPLLYPLQAGWVAPQSPWTLTVENCAPADVVSALLEGGLDAGMVSPVALARHGSELSTVGGWGVASEGITEGAVLLAPQRLDLMDGAGAAISQNAGDSIAEHLLRVLLKPYYDIDLTLNPPGAPGYDPGGMRLLLGDEAASQAQQKDDGWVAEDLGLALWVLTGLPVVWEILAVPRGLESAKPGAEAVLKDLLVRSQRSAQEQRATILEEAAHRLGTKREKAKDILSRHTYTLGEKEQKGLAQFLDMASRAGILRS
ncbi:MAG TPA: MqnA/MqnD/SBP family protein [Chloroflexia bacterium]|nr:MqnA/MqnD/SBP family protein [Chloroflexia bacterium]